MKIDSYAISMSSQHRQIEADLRQENLRYWTGDRQNQTAESRLGLLVDQIRQDLVDISDTARQLLAEQTAGAVQAGDEADLFELSDADKLKIQMIQDFIEALSGKKLKFYLPDTRKIKLNISADQLTLRLAGRTVTQPRYGWGLAYNLHERHYEAEQTTFASSGVVKTADGREINFAITFAASREYTSETNVSIRAGDALVDPLVINFAAPTASITAAKYAFDLDADGDQEQISFVGQGSGFLTLDKNGDGAVTDGSELFGPQSGNGFADLAAYDADGNNWIDENDPIYAKLNIWTKDENGNDRLLALGQSGVGAIYLGNVDTAFSYKDTANQLQAQLRRSGVFLREEGGVGTIQQVDLAV